MGLEIKLLNSLAEIPKLHAAVEAISLKHGIDRSTAFKLDLSLEEVFSNIVRYGFANQKPHEITIHMEVERDIIKIQVEDDGREFNPLLFPEPDVNLPLDERQVGRLGIHLVRNLMDEVDYQRVNEKNILLLKKKIQSRRKTDGNL